MRYQFRAGTRLPKNLSPETVVTELEKIKAEEGSLTPQAIVDAAQPETSPIHPAFEWDDGKAANHYRVWQARYLVKSVEVITTERKQALPVFVHVPVAGEPGSYQPTMDVLQDADMLQRALGELRSKLKSAERSVNALMEEVPKRQKSRMKKIQTHIAEAAKLSESATA